MCKHILLIMAAAFVAHLMPKQSVYSLQGIARTNSTVQWSPNYKDLNGMYFFQAIGNHTLSFDSTVIQVDGHTFFHLRGAMPNMHCETEEKVCKVIAHLIA